MTDAELNGPDVPFEDKRRELAGAQPEGDQVAYVREEEVDHLGHLTDTELDEGELEGRVNEDLPGQSEADNIEKLTELELRAGETDDPNVAAQEGMTYIPPTDPPVTVAPDDPQGVQIAAGFGMTATEDPYDIDHESEVVSIEDDMQARVREALRADAATTAYADSLAIAARGGTIGVRGVVDDVVDTDNVVEVISRVSGVDEVIDELEVRGVTG